ncbi:Rieske 2Fe-2S domain-containing protein [Chachezhania sediminis]|uniref:Rieske 2Fe-2S domain-containing protein n=1 Tax=Chachezhania sediminis TaxID=2599291 RepID=UPI00131B07E0|nr:Rieske 2Fe-2S domain-containing protein [Chachezhania sediminis]
MSVSFVPVQWNRWKWIYDAVLVAMVVLYVVAFIAVGTPAAGFERPIDSDILRARALGSCAFLMVSVILMIGPLARLDRRFLPLLYNRRHFGVLTFFVMLGHARFVLGWYFAFSDLPTWRALLSANTSYGQILGFPFEILGLAALLCFAVLATTSHDFWLSFLTAPVWKRLHMLIYPAYVLIVGHVTLGALQSQGTPAFSVVVWMMALAVIGLHLAAALSDRPAAPVRRDGPWERICRVAEIEEGTARIGLLGNGDKVAVFRHDGALNAISNACAHQNGPLGEGRIVHGCVTCPWHGFQYRLRDGRSPDPFTETVPTYRLEIRGPWVWVDARANPPGTDVVPVPVPEAAA